MSDTTIFLVGLFVTVLLGGGFTFSVLEVQRLGRKADARDAQRRR